MTDKKLRLLVKAIDQASATLRNIKSEAADMGGSFVGADQDAQHLGGGLAAIGAIGVGLITTTALTAARVETLGAVLNQVGDNAGYTEEELASFEAGLMGMGITLKASRQGLIQMMQAELGLTDATDLARLAQDAAVIANLNSSDAYERLITVVQRGEPVMARTMGLTVDFQGAYKRMAKQLNKSVKDLTQAEKLQARLNEVMDAGKEIAGVYEAAMETAGKQLGSLRGDLEDAAYALGVNFTPELGVAISFVRDILQAFMDLDPEQQKAIANFIGIGTIVTSVTGGFILLAPRIVATKNALAALGGVKVVAFLGDVGAGLSLMAGGASAAQVASLGLAGTVAAVVVPLAALAAIIATANIALEGHHKKTVALSGSYEQYVDMMRKTGRASLIMTELLWEQTKEQEANREATEGAATATEELLHTQIRAALTTREYGAALTEEQRGLREASLWTGKLTGQTTKLTAEETKARMGAALLGDEMADLTDEERQAAFWSGRLIDQYAALAKETKDLAAEMDMTAEGLATLDQQVRTLALAVAGPMKKANEDYIDQQARLNEKVAEGEAELADLQSRHGLVYGSQADLTHAQQGAELAARALAEAHADLAANTDPKQTLRLEEAIWREEGALRRANDAVRDASGGLTDYSEAIGEVEGDLAGWRGELVELDAQHDESIKRILYDILLARLAVGGWTEAEHELALAVALDMGIIDQETYDATVSMGNAIDEFDETADVDTATQRIRMMNDAMAEIGPTTQEGALAVVREMESTEPIMILVNGWWVDLHGLVRETGPIAKTASQKIMEGLWMTDPAFKDVVGWAGDAEDAINEIPRDITIHTSYTSSGTPPQHYPEGYQHGTDYVPDTGYAYLHEGEAVLAVAEAARYRAGGGGGRGRTIQIVNHFGRESIRSDEDVLLIADQIAQALELREGMGGRL